MKAKVSSIFWGLVLVLTGGLLLANTLGYVNLDVLEAGTWMLIFAAAALLFLVTYFMNGVQKWGWLFPACIFGSLALTIFLTESGVDGSILGAPILAAVAVPFLVAFALKPRERWWALIPAWVMIIITLTTAFADTINGNWIGALFMFGAALPFLLVYLLDRRRWWALIPAYVLGVIATYPVMSMFLNGNLMGAYVLFTIALPFLGVYLINRTHRWALIPASILGVVALIPLFSGIFDEDIVGAAVMFLFALAFFFVYFRWKSQWWAFIPAGIFATIGVIVVLSLLLPGNFEENSGMDGLMSGILLAGFGLTFGLLWLRRKSQPTDWAKYPAIGLFALALLAFVVGESYLKYWPVALLAVGIWLVVVSFLRKKSE